MSTLRPLPAPAPSAARAARARKPGFQAAPGPNAASATPPPLRNSRREMFMVAQLRWVAGSGRSAPVGANVVFAPTLLSRVVHGIRNRRGEACLRHVTSALTAEGQDE